MFLQKSARWFIRAFQVAICCGIIGGTLGLFGAAITHSDMSAVIGGAGCGMMVGATLLPISAWFMFLHMVSQLSAAIRGAS